MPGRRRRIRCRDPDIRPRPVAGGPPTFPGMGEYDIAHGMHVVHDGPRQAPLLLIHGSGASGGSWGPVGPMLAGRHHVIRVDLPGCGQSPPAPSYDVPAQAARVAALL